MGDDSVNLVDLLPPPFSVSMSLPQLMNAIDRGELHPVTGRPLPSPSPTAALDGDIAKWQSEKRQMHQQMRETLLAKSHRTTDPQKMRRLQEAAWQLQQGDI
jgi:hypothetical protein